MRGVRLRLFWSEDFLVVVVLLVVVLLLALLRGAGSRPGESSLLLAQASAHFDPRLLTFDL